MSIQRSYKKKLKTLPESSKVDDFQTKILPFKELRLPEKGTFLQLDVGANIQPTTSLALVAKLALLSMASNLGNYYSNTSLHLVVSQVALLLFLEYQLQEPLS